MPHDDTSLRCTCFRLRRAARLITNMYDDCLATVGLTTTQFAVLSELARAEPLPVSNLARRLGMDRTTMTRALKPLQRDGLVTAAQKNDESGDKISDRRIRSMQLTNKGRVLVGNALRQWRKAEQRITHDLGSAGVAALYQLLAKVEATSLNARHSEAPALAGPAAHRS